MSLGKRLFIGGGAGAAACPTDSVQPFGVDSAYSSNVALYQLDSDGGTTNNVPDTVGNHNGTASNVTYSTGKFGNAAGFNGSSSKITIPTSATTPIDFTSENFSISLWFKADSLHSGALIGKWSTSDGNGRALLLHTNSNGTFTFSERQGTSPFNLTTTSTYTADTWNHFVYVRNATQSILYLNTVSETDSRTNSINSGLTTELAIGYQTGGFKYFDGDIDQVRIYDKALSSDEVGVLYNETTSTASDTNVFNEGSGVALYSLDYDASDAGGNYDGTPTDVTFGVDGQINYGASFNGSSSKITLPNVIDFATGEHTISAWVYITDTTTSRFISNFYSGTIPDGSFDFVWIPSSNSINVDFKVGGSNYTNTITNVNSNEWIHIAATFVSNGTCTVYKNGTSIDTVTAPSFTGSSLQALNLGYYARGVDYWSGKIDQVRIFKKALSSTEVSTLYGETACVYTSTTDNNDYPVTNAAYYKLDNNAEDAKGNYDGTATNVNYEFGRYGQAAVFNGSSSYITANKSVFGTGDGVANLWSISLWFKTDGSVTASRTLVGTKGGSTQSGFFLYMISGGQIRYYEGNTSTNSQQLTTTTSYDDGNWHNVVITRSGTTDVFTMYIDGAEVIAPTTMTNPHTSHNFNLHIGRYPASATFFWDGSIDQVRVFDSALDATAVENLYNEKPEINTSNFETVLYNGNGGSQYVSNVGFQPDLVWIKSRSFANNHHLFDVIRGPNNILRTSSNSQEANVGDVMPSFDSNGFTVGEVAGNNATNDDGSTFVAWCWKAGGDAVNNTNGNITSQVSANQDAGFSIVKYTGNGTNGATVGHGLSSAPELIITKGLGTAYNWNVVTSLLQNGYLELNTGSNFSSNSSRYITAGATTNNLTDYVQFNQNNIEHIAYCFHSVTGYQKIGGYTGNGSNTGPTITTGFRPRFVLIKGTNTTAAKNWNLFDTVRDTDANVGKVLHPNLNNQEGDYGANSLNMSDTGFSVNDSDSDHNENGKTYIYLAIA